MINIPAFRTHMRVDVFPGEGVLLLSEEGSTALYGGAYEKIVPLIDGQRTADEIVDALDNQVDVARVYYVLNGLEARGFLTESTPNIPLNVTAFWHSVGVEAAAALAALRDQPVAVQPIDGVDPTPMVAALENTGVTIRDREHARLWLVLTDDYLHGDLAAINAAALEAKRPWLLVRLTGRELWLGPLFRPDQTGCWRCMRSRLMRNRAVHCFIAERKNLAAIPFTAVGALPATQAAACQMAAVAAAQFLACGESGLAGKVLSLDWATFTTQTHELIRHPHCSACGVTEVPATQPIQLKSGKAAFVRDGGHRSVAPEKTLKKYEHLVSPITGVVRMLVPIRQENGVAPVYVAGHNAAMRMDRLDFLKRGLRNASCGKGISGVQAKTSALCEAIERYSGELTGGEFRKTCAWQDWQDGEAIHPNEVMLYSTRQYAERETWNKKGSRFNMVPEPLNDDVRIDWTPVWSLTAERHRYLPTQLVYFQAPASDVDRTIYSVGCSNGNAAGNTLEEAILQGFFELVERDAVALWWYNRLTKPGVAVETFDEPGLLDLAAYYDTIGREVWALDITTDLGIPAFAAISRLRHGPEERILFGLGCHLEARIALQRAYAEMNQMLGMAEDGENGKILVDDDETVRWLKTATVANQPYLTPDTTMPTKRAADYPQHHSDDLLGNILLCRQIVEERGMEMLVLDQTRADVGMPVVKVVVPGLRHFWARFAPGRLYDVPVQMGWLPQPLAEEQLNPVPMFF